MYINACAEPVRSVTPMDFYRLGAGVLGATHVQVDERAELAASSMGKDHAPSPPPTPVCVYEERPTRQVDAAPRCIAEDELFAAPAPTPVSKGKQHFVTRPELDMDLFGGNKPVLCWDTETAGLGKPAICQLAYSLVSANKSLRMYDKIWKLPEGVCMSRDATKIHGITPEHAKKGVDPVNELIAFWELVNQVLAEGGVVVGHNVQFDCRAFNFTSEKWGLPNTLEHRHMLDTMKESKRYSTLTTVKGHPKAFKNDELCENDTSNKWHFLCPPPTNAAAVCRQTSTSAVTTPHGHAFTTQRTTST